MRPILELQPATVRTLIACVCLPALASAGLCSAHFWTLKEISAAPVVVVGKVLQVQKGPNRLNPPSAQSAPAEYMVSEVQVLRAYAPPGASRPQPADLLKIRFLGRDGPTFGPCPQGLPEIEADRVLLLPLQSNSNPTSDPWKLIGVEGFGITVPVHAEMGLSGSSPTDSRSFTIREIANSLSRGTPSEMYAASLRVGTEGNYLLPELIPLLDAAVADNRNRWAAIAGSMLVLHGNNREAPLTVREAMAGRISANVYFGQGFPVAVDAFQKLLNPADAQALIIKTLIGNTADYAEQSRNTLFSYKDDSALRMAASFLVNYRSDPVLVESLKLALRQDLAGSSFLAWRLAEEGQKECITDAVARALKVVDRPGSNVNDLFGATAIIRQYGNDRERRQLAKAVAKYRDTNSEFSAFLSRQMQ